VKLAQRAQRKRGSPMYCRQCSYDLHAIPSSRCPECGRGFDPSNPKSFRKRPQTTGGRWLRRALVAVVVLTALIGGPLGWVYWGWCEEKTVISRLQTDGFVVNTVPLLPPRVSRLLPNRIRPWLDRADEVFFGAGPYSGPQRRPQAVNLRGLSALSRVQTVFLCAARVENAEMQEISQLAHLKTLQLLESSFSDGEIAQLSELTELEELWLDGSTRLTDASLGSIRDLAHLKVLRLYRANFTDAGVKHLAGLSELENLQLGETLITDAGMPVIGQLKKLKTLDIRARITDNGLKELEGLTQLQWLCLDHNDITDAGLVCLRNLTLLRWLSIEDTNVTDAGLLHLKGLKKLEHVGARRTGVTARGLLDLNGLPL
jgi:hypothetical protein